MTGTNLQIITFDKSQYGTSDYPMGGKLHSQWKTKIYKGWVRPNLPSKEPQSDNSQQAIVH